MPLEYLISALVTLLVVLDPVGIAPTFQPSPTGCRSAHRRESRCALMIAGAS